MAAHLWRGPGAGSNVWLAGLWRDIRYGVRALRRTPVFALGSVITVALTVGATTAIFSVAYAVLLSELPYAEPERLVWIWSDQPGRDRTPFNVPDFIDYRDGMRTLAGLAGYFAAGANLDDEAAAERVQGIRATGNLFGVLGAHAAIGRLLQPHDAFADVPGAVVLSEAYWKAGSAAIPGSLASRSGSTASPTSLSASRPPASRCRSATSTSCCRSRPIWIRAAAPATRSTSSTASVVSRRRSA